MAAPLGPVSKAVEADLGAQVQRHGIVVWLDADAAYTPLVDRLAALRAEDPAAVPYLVAGFRGSHLELMLALEGVAGGVDKPHLVVHLPGFNEETVKDTPLLELYRSGARWRRALDTAIREAAAGRVRAEQVEAFFEGGPRDLEQADAWLSALLDGRDGGIADDLRATSLPAVVDDLLRGGFFSTRLESEDDREAIWSQLATWTGLPDEWRKQSLPPGEAHGESVAFAVASWALAVEYVDDLARKPVDERLAAATALARPVAEACRALAAHLRDAHTSFYTRTADETEGWLADEVQVAKAEDLGKIDTFRFEEDVILRAALAALGADRWEAAEAWAAPRADGGSFWLRDDAARRSAWQLVLDGARLCRAIARAGPTLGGAPNIERATDQYVKKGAEVDAAHRHLEQRRAALLYPQLPEFETLRAELDRLRQVWRQWADDWALSFNRGCRSHGFLPGEALQQRHVFEDVVRPLTKEPGVTAFFLVDAFRYEMAEELRQALDGTAATTVRLEPRLAELPTVTEVGMNVLPPVAGSGKLRPALASGRIQGFATGEFRVHNPDTRKRAIADRVGGETCPWLELEDVVNRDSTSLKQAVARARLVVVHSREIDDAGEKGVGPAVFDLVMQKLRAAWRLLREAGVRHFVITADHGFLLLDESAYDRAQSHGRKVDPKRRHVFSTVPADHAGEVRVPLSELGYEGVEDQHLMFPETTAVFDTGARNMSFVHGGNSLQERVIPVLTIAHRAAAGSDTLSYAVSATARDGVAGMECLEAKVEVGVQGALDFGGVQEVELGLRVLDAPDVHVDLCQTRGKARLSGGSILATVGESFELFFRLAGATTERVQVQLFHPSAEANVASKVVESRFTVSGTGAAVEPSRGPVPPAEGPAWLDVLAAEVRPVFQHMADYGSVKEDEVTRMLGSSRAARKFARQLEEHAKKIPFAVRIDVAGGVKTYVKG